MNQKALITAFVLLLLVFSFGCSNYKQDSNQPVVISAKNIQQKQQVEETETATSENNDIKEQDQKDKQIDGFVNDLIAEITLLRTDGTRLMEEDNLEEARKTLDEALNIILNSGLALDAHPQVAGLFKDITKEVVRIEDAIAENEEEVSETTLVEELTEVETVELDTEEEQVTEVTFDLPVVQNARVEQFIELFTTGSKREAIAAGIQRSGQFIERFREILKEEGVPQDLVYLAMIESTYKVRAYSRARAKGIWQFMSWTGKRYGLRIDWWVDERSDPFKACRAAARYLKDLHAELGDWLLAMAAYNGGPGRVNRAIKRYGTRDFWELSKRTYLRRETRNFVPSILAAAIIMKQPDKYGFDEVKLDLPWQFDEIKINSPIDLRIVAELSGIKADDVVTLNPALRRMITPQNYENFQLRLPKGTGEGLEEKIAALPVQKRLKYTEHLVQRGHTLSAIAKRYGSSVSAIQQANNIRNPRALRPGTHLIIPLSPGSVPSYASSNSRSSSLTKGEKISHTIRRGDSLYSISRRYGTTVGSIAKWNNLDPKRAIHPGKKLTIYALSRADSGTSYSSTESKSGARIVYQVKQGDTLYDIANKYKTTVRDLKRWNNLRRNTIHPGDRLTVYLNHQEKIN